MKLKELLDVLHGGYVIVRDRDTCLRTDKILAVVAGESPQMRMLLDRDVKAIDHSGSLFTLTVEVGGRTKTKTKTRKD